MHQEQSQTRQPTRSFRMSFLNNKVPPVFRIPNNDDHDRVSALFLGPKAENAGLLQEFFSLIVQGQSAGRRAYFPDDPVSALLRFYDHRQTRFSFSHLGLHRSRRAAISRLRPENQSVSRCAHGTSWRTQQVFHSVLFPSLQRAHVCRSKHACYPWLPLDDVL